MKRLVTLLVLAAFFPWLPARAGIKSDQAAYVGGTETIEEGVEGYALVGSDKEFVYEYSSGQLVIPYDQVNDLEYGEKAGRRVGLAIAIAPPFIFSKKKGHFLTIGWKDEAGKQHAAVFELGKSIIRKTITVLEEKTGKKVEYQDGDARKNAKAGAKILGE